MCSFSKEQPGAADYFTRTAVAKSNIMVSPACAGSGDGSDRYGCECDEDQFAFHKSVRVVNYFTTSMSGSTQVLSKSALSGP